MQTVHPRLAGDTKSNIVIGGQLVGNWPLFQSRATFFLSVKLKKHIFCDCLTRETNTGLHVVNAETLPQKPRTKLNEIKRASYPPKKKYFQIVSGLLTYIIFYYY